MKGDIYHFGLYSNLANIDSWDISALMGYAYGDHRSKRTTSLSSINATAASSYNSHSFYAGIRATNSVYQNEIFTLSPELGFDYIYYNQDSLKESGSPNLNLKIDSADAQSIIASIGLNAKFSSISKSSSIHPLASIRYEHDFYANHNNEHDIDAAFVAHPENKQTFVGQNRGENSIVAGLGLGSDISSALQIQASYVRAEHSHGSEWGANFDIVYRW